MFLGSLDRPLTAPIPLAHRRRTVSALTGPTVAESTDTLVLGSRTPQTTAVWAGPKGRELFSWFHIPAGGAARGGVLLCPPLGRELTGAYPSYRRVAVHLAALGLAVLRFDLTGTGDSPGDAAEKGLFVRWLSDLGIAADLLRSSGCETIAAVGIRSGALLLAESMRRAELDAAAAVLWSPYPSGRRFLRSEQALYRLSLSSPSSPLHTDIPGFRYARETGDALGATRLGPLPSAPGRAFHVVQRNDRPLDDATLEALGSAVTVASVEGSTDLLDVLAAHAELPIPGEDAVVEWLDRHFDAERHPVQAPTGQPAIVLRPGGEVIEDRVERLGPTGLFGVVSTPAAGTSKPWVLLPSVADEHHIGPSRLWVDLARRLTAAGFPCVRFDLSGIGDSPARSGQPPHRILAAGTDDDMAEVAAHVAGHDPVVIIGLCSGADAAIMAASAGVAIQTMYLINPSLGRGGGAGATGGSRRSRARDMLKHKAILKKAKQRAPVGTWRLLDLVGAERSPFRMLLPLAPRAGQTVLVCGGADARWMEERGGWLIRRMQQKGRLAVHSVPGLDHSAAGTEGRRSLVDFLVDDLTRRFPTVRPDEQTRGPADRNVLVEGGGSRASAG